MRSILRAGVLTLLLALLGATVASAVTVVDQNTNVSCYTNVPREECEHENPLTALDQFNNEELIEWKDADYHSPGDYEDWTANDNVFIDGCSSEVWLRWQGHILYTATTVASSRIFVSLNGDDNDGVCEVWVDGQWMATLDMYSRPGAETVVVLIEQLSFTGHQVEVRDMGESVEGADDIAIFGCGVLGSQEPEQQKEAKKKAWHWWTWLKNLWPFGIYAVHMENPRFVPGDDPGNEAIGGAFRSADIRGYTQLGPQPEPPDSWARVERDPLSATYLQEAWFYFSSVEPDSMAPEMDVGFAMPDTTVADCDLLVGWYEVDYTVYYDDGQPAEQGTLSYRIGALPIEGAVGVSPPAAFRVRPQLDQNVPNPFNPSTKISYRLESAAEVKLSIFDLRGRLVRTLVSGPRGAGPHVELWDGRDLRGRPAASGSYLYVLDADGARVTRKLVLLK